MDFYAPYPLGGGRFLFGAAAMNKRLADAGGMNNVAGKLIAVGYKQAVKDTARSRNQGKKM